MRTRGFTLLEILVALSLLALISGVLMGALSLTGRSLDGGEQKAEKTANMRLAQEFLREQLETQLPLRWRRIADAPIMFGGDRESMRFSAAVPARVTGGGIWLYRLAIGRDGDRTPLVLERTIPDANALDIPDFRDADRSILASDVDEVVIGYLGRDPLASEAVAPTWRDRWDDKQRLPLLIRIEVRPRNGAPWPPLVVAPRVSPEAGCRQWDVVVQRCTSA